MSADSTCFPCLESTGVGRLRRKCEPVPLRSGFRGLCAPTAACSLASPPVREFRFSASALPLAALPFLGLLAADLYLFELHQPSTTSFRTYSAWRQSRTEFAVPPPSAQRLLRPACSAFPEVPPCPCSRLRVFARAASGGEVSVPAAERGASHFGARRGPCPETDSQSAHLRALNKSARTKSLTVQSIAQLDHLRLCDDLSVERAHRIHVQNALKASMVKECALTSPDGKRGRRV